MTTLATLNTATAPDVWHAPTTPLHGVRLRLAYTAPFPKGWWSAPARDAASPGRPLTASDRSPLVIAAEARASQEAQDRARFRVACLLSGWKYGPMGMVLHADDRRRWPRLVPQRACGVCGGSIAHLRSDATVCRTKRCRVADWRRRSKAPPVRRAA